jgi:hypothetical protein
MQRRGTFVISLNGDQILYKGKGRKETLEGDSCKSHIDTKATATFSEALSSTQLRIGR